MKWRVLKSIGYSFADSLAAGIGNPTFGYQSTDIFGEAARTPEGFIEVDFLTGSTSGGQPSPSLADAVTLYANALPGVCGADGIDVSEIRQLAAHFSATGSFRRFVVTVEDQRGRRSISEYAAVGPVNMKRVKVLDHLGRPRPK